MVTNLGPIKPILEPIIELNGYHGRTRRYLILFCAVIGMGRLGVLSVGRVVTYVPDLAYGVALAVLTIALLCTAKLRLHLVGRAVTALVTGVMFAYGFDMFLRDAYTSALLIWTIAYMGLVETGSTT